MKKEVNYKNTDGIKLALAIRQLESSEVMHDGYDVDEDGVEAVLKEYGIFNTWTEDEREILKMHLIDMAFREEVKETARWANSDPVLAYIPLKKAKNKPKDPEDDSGLGI